MFDNFEPWVSLTKQGKLLTKLNPRFVMVFKSLPWLVNLFIFLSQYCVQQYLHGVNFINILCARANVHVQEQIEQLFSNYIRLCNFLAPKYCQKSLA